jgi:hypothetical protein
MTCYMYCCVISAIVSHYYKISLFTCYLCYRGCMCDAIVSVEMCLSVNDINVCW